MMSNDCFKGLNGSSRLQHVLDGADATSVRAVPAGGRPGGAEHRARLVRHEPAAQAPGKQGYHLHHHCVAISLEQLLFPPVRPVHLPPQVEGTIGNTLNRLALNVEKRISPGTGKKKKIKGKRNRQAKAGAQPKPPAPAVVCTLEDEHGDAIDPAASNTDGFGQARWLTVRPAPPTASLVVFDLVLNGPEVRD